MSVVSLLLCMLMLIGATFAWYSKDVTSGENLIRIGAFNVDVLYSEDYAEWSDLADAVLFNDVELVPGEATKVMYIRVVNRNTYPVVVDASLIAKTVTDNNADLMFYSKAVTAAATEADLLAETGVSLTTAAQFVTEVEVPASDGTNHGTFDTAILVALPGDSEAEGIEARFKIQLTATQAHEETSSPFNAVITPLTGDDLSVTYDMPAEGSLTLDVGVRFTCNDTVDTMDESLAAYKVDFVLSFSKPVLASDVTLYGYYASFGSAVAFTLDNAENLGDTVTEFQVVSTAVGQSPTYEDVVALNTFDCGISIATTGNEPIDVTLKLIAYNDDETIVIKELTYTIDKP